jgi:hypothetical protein
MAKGTKTGGKDFKVGHAGGPGRPKLPDDLREIKKITPDFVHRLIAKFGRMDLEAIEKVVADKASTAFDVMIGMIIIKAVKDGDYKRLDFLFDRTVGKVLQQVQVETIEPMVIRGKESGKELMLTAKDTEGQIIDVGVDDAGDSGARQ